MNAFRALRELWNRAHATWSEVTHQPRETWSAEGRTYIDMGAFRSEHFDQLESRLQEAYETKDTDVHWVRVNRALRRVVVAHEKDIAAQELLDQLEKTERELGESFTRGLDHDAFGLPGDRVPISRAQLEFAATLIGLNLGLIMRLLRFRQRSAEIDLAALLSVIRGSPQIQEALKKRFSPARYELFISLSGNLVDALLQSTAGPVVGIVEHWLRLRELEHRNKTWSTVEEELGSQPISHEQAEVSVESRPRPLPPGPIEKYADHALFAAFGAFGLGLVSTRRIDYASTALFGATPRPALCGRESFCAHLSRLLSDRGILVLQPLSLRLLDRVTDVIIERELLEGEWGGQLGSIRKAAARAGVSLAVLDSEDTLDAVRKLQEDGRCVCCVSAGSLNALVAADVSLGIAHASRPIPWSAHLLSRNGIDDARIIVESIGAARRTSEQSVQLALIEAASGLLLSLYGLKTETVRKVMLASSAASLLAIFNGVRHAHQVRIGAAKIHPDPTPWHALDVEETLTRLDSRREGLDSEEAVRRHRLTPKPAHGSQTYLGMFFDEIANPLTPVLAAGAGLSALTGALVDAGLIGSVMTFNACIGAAQRFRTNHALEKLQGSQERTALVRRDGSAVELDRASLVRGDVLELRAGALVQADARLIESVGLELDESSLTGESLPVRKHATPRPTQEAVADRCSMVYDGTTVVAGVGIAVVVALGNETEAERGFVDGSSSAASGGVEERLDSLTSFTAPVAAAAGAALIAAGVARNRPSEEVIGAGASLAVAAVPEGLPLIATIAQLTAADRLRKRGAWVRNARAIEALGRVDIFCLDKTGTLTKGKIEFHSVSDGQVERRLNNLTDAHRGILAAALRATPNGTDRFAHLTDQALVDGAHKVGVELDEGLGTGAASESWKPVYTLPFEPARGYHATLGRSGERQYVSVKGAPEVVLRRCAALDPTEHTRLLDEGIRMAAMGLRVLAIAEKPIELCTKIRDAEVKDLRFRGFVGLADPARPTAGAALERLSQAGIRVTMITGDHPSTATAIATELGLGNNPSVITGVELESLDDIEFAQRIAKSTVFARVTPAQKVRIVQALQQDGHTVAMTGDGANDAPAIRFADVGIALGVKSTAAARDCADLIVTDERIETLVDAVLEGRALWVSVRDAVSLLVGGNLGEVCFTLIAGLISGRSPLNARQLLLVNLLTDTLPAIVVAARPPLHLEAQELIHEGPEGSLGDALKREIIWRAALTTTVTAVTWSIARATGTRERANTVALLTLVGSQLAQTAVAGGRGPWLKSTMIGTSAALLGIVQTPGLSHFFGCRPLGPVGLSQAACGTLAATALSHWRSDNMSAWLDRVLKSLRSSAMASRGTSVT